MIHDISFMDVITRELQVMDTTAITICRENDIPIRVFNLLTAGNIVKAVVGDDIGTLVH